VALANNTRYGLAASVWSQDIDQALETARGVQAGTVWINSTNLFDASSGFGGYRESGYGREGGPEGLWEYLRRPGRAHAASYRAHTAPAEPASNGQPPAAEPRLPPIDRTPKLFIGGKQVRPDSGYSRAVLAPDGQPMGEVGEGNRKDIRNAVEAAHAALPGWSGATAYNRAQVLYYLAENLSARSAELAARLARMTGVSAGAAAREVEASIERLFTFGAWADKHEGRVHTPPLRGLALALTEPVGVIGIACPTAEPLLGLVALVAPAIALGNTVVAVPSDPHPLAATDFYQVLETSDVPPGVVNIVTGDRELLAKVLAEHDDVDAVWYVGTPDGRRAVEAASVGNMKRTWTALEAEPREWPASDEELLHQASQVKNVWVVY
jgi:aldehyde dehydrogenase (NAD+)